MNAMRPLTRQWLTVTLLLLAVVLAPPAALGQDYRTADGLTVYLGVLPAAMVAGRHEAHPGEEAMHDGVPRGRHAFHIVAAVFDAESGEQIHDARVEARVPPFGLAGIRRPLEPMKIGETVTYGNYFTLRGGPYRIELSIDRPDALPVVTVDFTYEHRTR
jgi:hypothetical protein